MISDNVMRALEGQEVTGLKGEKGKVKVDAEVFAEHPLEDWVNVVTDDELSQTIAKYASRFVEATNEFEEKVKTKRSQIEMGDDLSPGY